MSNRKFNAAEVSAAIDAEYSYENEFYDNVDTNGYDLPTIGVKAYAVEREGGYEGGGDYMDVVFKVGDQLFRKQGAYNSWDSNEWDGSLEEVEPYEETVVKYRTVKG